MKILVVEDDAEAASYLIKGLRESGHVVDHAADGETGLEMALSSTYDVAVVDRMLPRRDGLSLISAVRAEGRELPILILSALGQVDDRVLGLRALTMLDPDAVARAVVAAVEDDQATLRMPRRAAPLATLAHAPRSVVRLALTGIR